MAFSWVIVGGTGYDAEDVRDAQTRDMVCPACERHVRFVEKELIKNLRVLGVPLVGIEKGRRVFECPHCRACVEQPADAPEAVTDERLTHAQDEVWLWRRRAELAARRGDATLAAEATELAAKAEREATRLRGAAARAAETPAAKPVIVARAAERGVTPEPGYGGKDSGGDSGVGDEFAALKARLARRSPDDASADEGTPVREARAEDAPAPPPGTSVGAEAGTPTATPVATPGPTPAPSPATAADAGLDDEFAALKARLARRSVETTPTADEAPVAGSERPATGSAATAPAASAAPRPGSDDDGGAGDDDPVAALKRKLRRPGGGA